MQTFRKKSRSRFSKIAWQLAAVAGFSLILLASANFAQQPPEKKSAPLLEGKVCDSSGAVIPGVAVRLQREGADSDPAFAFGVDATSDQSGNYVIAAPGAGRYFLRASKTGFKTQVIKDIELASGGTRQIDLVMEIDRTPSGADCCLPRGPTQESPLPPLQFADTPNFTVAGVTDYSSAGLHGSDANVRTSEALAKETAALKPGSKTALSSSPGELHRFIGDAKEKSGDPVAAEKEYEQAVRLDPSEENYFAWGAELLLHRAGPASVQVFARGSQLHPWSARLHAGLGAAYYADGQYPEAAAQMCTASDLNPTDPQPYLFLGRMERAAAEPLPCSEEKLARFAAEQPTNALANYYYGLLLWKTARKAQDAAGLSSAENYLRKAIELVPSLGEAYLQLGTLYYALGKRDAALAEFQKAVAAEPRLSAAHYQLSLAYRRAGDSAKAAQEMKTYDELRRSEDAELEKEHREMRQFVTILKDNRSSAPH